MRLKTELWVRAYVRRRQSEGAYAAIVRHGHDEAGAVLIKINRLDGQAALYGPAPMSFSDTPDDLGERRFARLHEAEWVSERQADEIVARQRSYDEDLWVIEVEDRAGEAGLEGWLATP